jgi:cytochrome c biogenesis protein CcmG/thiol:disulfide interchange protein DsbE
MKRVMLFIPLIAFIVLAVFLMRGISLDPSAMPSALINKPFPAFSLPALQTQAIVTEKSLHGQKALVNVWATWCVTCRVEHPFLMQLSQKNIPIYGISYKDSNAAALTWLKEKGNPYRTTIVDAEGKLGIDLGVFGAPETYFVDSSGIIRYKHVGDLNERNWNDELNAVWKKMH